MLGDAGGGTFGGAASSSTELGGLLGVMVIEWGGGLIGGTARVCWIVVGAEAEGGI